MTAAPMPQVTVLVAWQHGPLTDPNLIDGYLGPDNVAANKWTVMSRCGTSPGYVTQLPAGGRGRQHELAVFEAATRRMRFDNADGRFNPWNTASPYYAWLKPGRLMRVLAQWNLLSVRSASYTAASTGTVEVIPPGGGNVHRSFAVVPSRRYSAWLGVTPNGAGVSVAPRFRWYDAAGTLLSSTTGATVAAPASVQTALQMLDVAPPTGAFSADFVVVHTATTAGVTTSFNLIGVWPVGAIPAGAIYAEGSPARFTGHIHAFDPEWPDRRSFYVDAEASDLLRVLNTLKLPASAFEAETLADTPSSYWPLSESAGATAANDVKSAAPGSYQSGATLGGAAVIPGGGSSLTLPTAASSTYAAKLGNVPATAPFSLSFAVDGITLPGSAVLVGTPARRPAGAAFFISYNASGFLVLDLYDDTGALEWNFVTPYQVADGKPHLVQLERSSATVWRFGFDTTTGVSTRSGTYTFAAPLEVGSLISGTGTGQLAGVALFPNVVAFARREVQYNALIGIAWRSDNASVRVGRILDLVGVPAGLRNLADTGVSLLRGVGELGGTALAHLQQVERAEAGALYVDRTGKVTLVSRKTIFGRAYNTPTVTFGDATGQVPYQPGPSMTYNDSEVVNEVTAGRDGGLAATVVDTASRDDYGPRSRDLTGLLLRDDTEVLDRANFELATYADARFVLRNLNVWPLEATGKIETLLALDLLQLVSVARSDIVGTALNQPSLLERIEETFTPVDWRISIAVSPHQAEQFWVLDASRLDVNTRLGF